MARAFNGINQYISLGAHANVNISAGDWAISVGFDVGNNAGAAAHILYFGGAAWGATPFIVFGIGQTGAASNIDHLFLTAYSGAAANQRIGENPGDFEGTTKISTLSAGIHFVLITFNATTQTASMYLDGVLENTDVAGAWAGAVISGTNNWIGKYGANWLKGSLLFFATWNDWIPDATERAMLGAGSPPDQHGTPAIYIPMYVDEVDEKMGGPVPVNFGSTYDPDNDGLANTLDVALVDLPNTYQLETMQLRSNDAGRLCWTQDSIVAGLTPGIPPPYGPNRKSGLFVGALQVWNPWTLGGVMLPNACSVANAGYTGTHVDYAWNTHSVPVSPLQNGIIAPTVRPILPFERQEMEIDAAGAGDHNVNCTRLYLDPSLLPAGADEWAVGDWLSGHVVRCNHLYYEHDKGMHETRFYGYLDGVATFRAEVDTSAGHAADDSIHEIDFLIGPVAPGWASVGMQMGTDQAQTIGDGHVSLHSHFYVQDGGVHLGHLAYTGTDVVEWAETYRQDGQLALLIEHFKYDTFVLFSGTNEATVGWTKTHFKCHLREMMEVITTAHATAQAADPTIRDLHFHVVTPYPTNGGATGALQGEYAEAMYELLFEDNILRDFTAYSFHNYYTEMGGTAGYAVFAAAYLADGTHPNDAGAIYIAQQIWNPLQIDEPVIPDVPDVPVVGRPFHKIGRGGITRDPFALTRSP